MKFLFGGFGYFFCLQMERFLTSGIQRAMLYERKLGQAIVPRRRKARKAKPEPEQEGMFYIMLQWVLRNQTKILFQTQCKRLIPF